MQLQDGKYKNRKNSSNYQMSGCWSLWKFAVKIIFCWRVFNGQDEI